MFLPPFRTLRLVGGILPEGSVLISFDGKEVQRFQLSEPALTSDFDTGLAVLRSDDLIHELASSRDGRVVAALDPEGGLLANLELQAEQPATAVALDQAEPATLVALGLDGRVEVSLLPKTPAAARGLASIAGASRPALAAFPQRSFAIAFDEGGFARMRRYSCPELQ